MNTATSHRLVALAMSVVLSLGLFEAVSGFAAPEHASQLLVRADSTAADRG